MRKEIEDKVETLTEVKVNAPISVFGLGNNDSQVSDALLSDIESIVSNFESNEKTKLKLQETNKEEISNMQKDVLIHEINTSAHKYAANDSAKIERPKVCVQTLNIF